MILLNYVKLGGRSSDIKLSVCINLNGAQPSYDLIWTIKFNIVLCMGQSPLIKHYHFYYINASEYEFYWTFLSYFS